MSIELQQAVSSVTAVFSGSESNALSRASKEFNRARVIITATVYSGLPQLTELVAMSADKIPALPSAVVHVVALAQPLGSFWIFRKPQIDVDVLAQIRRDEETRLGVRAQDGGLVKGTTEGEMFKFRQMDEIAQRGNLSSSDESREVSSQGNGHKGRSGKNDTKPPPEGEPERMRQDHKILAEDALIKQLNSGEISSGDYAKARRTLKKR